MATQHHDTHSASTDIADADVISGRDKLAFTHPGNRVFRSLVIAHGHAYQAANFRKQKARIVNTIIDVIHNSGGRFLSLEGSGAGSIGWVEMNQATTYQKVAHALRSSKPADQRSRPVNLSSASWSPSPSASSTAIRTPGYGATPQGLGVKRRASDSFDEIILQRIKSCDQFDDDLSTLADDETDSVASPVPSEAIRFDTATFLPCDITDLLVKEHLRANIIIDDDVIATLLSELYDDESSQSTFYTMEGERAEF
jgi:hypothetical protein